MDREKRRKRIGKTINPIPALMVILGVMLMLYPLFPHLYSYYQQYKLQASFAQSQQPASSAGAEQQNDGAGPPPTNQSDAPKEPVVAPKEPAVSAPAAASQDFKLAMLEIPAIDLSKVVLRGTSVGVLKKGPGWYEESALPGQGNTAIAGHLNTDGSPFRLVPQLKPGDSIKLTFEGRGYKYRVERVFTIESNDWSVIGPCGYSALTLTTCVAGDPKHRLVVRAAEVK